MFTFRGKGVILFVWIFGTLLAIYGCSQVEVDFKVEFFIKPGSFAYNAL